MNTCLARRMSDEMVCNACRLRWDVSDKEPPACGKTVRAKPQLVDANANRPWDGTLRKDRERLPFASGLPSR